MNLREKLGWFIFLKHVEDSYLVPFETDRHIGTGYFKIDYRWYNFIKFISGLKPEKLMEKALRGE